MFKNMHAGSSPSRRPDRFSYLCKGHYFGTFTVFSVPKRQRFTTESRKYFFPNWKHKKPMLQIFFRKNIIVLEMVSVRKTTFSRALISYANKGKQRSTIRLNEKIEKKVLSKLNKKTHQLQSFKSNKEFTLKTRETCCFTENLKNQQL